MTHRTRGGRALGVAAGLASLATIAAFLAPTTLSTLAGGAAIASAQTLMPGTSCAATLAGTALDRSGWVASTNAPSSSADSPSNAIDGNLATRFSTDETQRPGLYFEVNMGSQQTFDEVDMQVPNSPTDFATSYDVMVSSNGTEWTTVATCTGSSTPEVVSFPPQTAQYLMVFLTGTSNYYWSIDELNVLTSATGASCFAAPTGTALSRTGWVASTNAPSSSADSPANAIDGNLATRFSTDETQRPGLYFEVNMGSPQTFDQLQMDVPNSPNDYARDYAVEVSSNGSSWTTVANCFGTGTPEVVSFPAQTAQYVAVYLTGTDNTYWWSIDEFNLYTTLVPPTTTTTTTTVPTSTTTTTVPSTTTTTAVPVRPTPPFPHRFRRFFCVTWGWGHFHMWHRVVRVLVCFRVRPFPFRGFRLGFGHGGFPGFVGDDGPHGHGPGPRGPRGDRH
jgi:hypothetical protein